MARVYLGTDPVTGEDLWSEPAPEETAAINEPLPAGTFDEMLAPIRGSYRASGATEAELAADFEAAREEVHRERGEMPVAEAETPEEAGAEEDEAEQSSAPVHLRGPLPDGFPGKAAFVAAGFNTYAKVRKLYKAGELRTVDNVGEVTEMEVEMIFRAEG